MASLTTTVTDNPTTINKSSTINKPPTIDDQSNFSSYQATDEEKTALQTFLTEFPTFQNVPPGKVLRFLRARDFDIQQTHTFLTTHLEWYTQTKPDSITLNDVSTTALESGFVRYLGSSDDTSPVLLVRLALWNPHEYTKEEFQNYLIYLFVMIQQTMSNGGKTKGIVLVDLSGWSIWMVSYLGYLRAAVDITQNQFPERLRRVMLFNAPYIFRGAW